MEKWWRNRWKGKRYKECTKADDTKRMLCEYTEADNTKPMLSEYMEADDNRNIKRMHKKQTIINECLEIEKICKRSYANVKRLYAYSKHIWIYVFYAISVFSHSYDYVRSCLRKWDCLRMSSPPPQSERRTICGHLDESLSDRFTKQGTIVCMFDDVIAFSISGWKTINSK